ncbi:hypothetical protein GCM10023189_48000 [Nibrella saemangeumensis]|uniref:GAF domain-containing protein n=1 Tax=Nibrella saemangeumensis TaxID=1084526 RepID=A0ABP8NIV1_9BACT
MIGTIASLEPLLNSDLSPGEKLSQIVGQLGEILRVDRCFLYVRDPAAGRGRIAFCWLRDTTIPDVFQPSWQDDTTDLPDEDPLFAAALAGKPSVYVDDVKMAEPDVLNRDFEDRTFGHSALVHAHIMEGETLWGILQPCMFGKPRHWTEQDRAFIEPLLPRLAPIIQSFVRMML